VRFECNPHGCLRDGSTGQKQQQSKQYNGRLFHLHPPEGSFWIYTCSILHSRMKINEQNDDLLLKLPVALPE
jgi:hypothetical protein